MRLSVWVKNEAKFPLWKLSPLILTPSVLQTTIQDIQVILDKDYNGYKVLTSDPNYYYKYASLK
jgi:hypothetical protein